MRSNLERVGKMAIVRYAGGVQGEEALDTTGDDVRRIEFGAGQVPIGMENALFEMEIGERATIVIPPAEGFGEHDPKGVVVVQRENLPNGSKLEVGSVLGWRSPVTGARMPAYVVEATPDYVKLDHNHPFAGKVLQYEVELVGIE